MRNAVIIVAGGKGSRMGTELPKQFLSIGQYPVLMYTIDKFYQFNNQMQIIVVLPGDQMYYWQSLCQELRFTIKHDMVEGGQDRFFSVKNGLEKLNAIDFVAIHDGVRPFVSIETIGRTFKVAQEKGNAIPVVEMNESIRKLEDAGSKIVDRNQFKIVQTPQVFKTDILKKAYQQEYLSKFTDDASVLENLGYGINLVEGNIENIKITHPHDILLAKQLVNLFGKLND